MRVAKHRSGGHVVTDRHQYIRCVIGDKKIRPIRWDTSGANPMGWKYVLNPTQGDDTQQGCV